MSQEGNRRVRWSKSKRGCSVLEVAREFSAGVVPVAGVRFKVFGNLGEDYKPDYTDRNGHG